jgi:hypothetical protein
MTKLGRCKKEEEKKRRKEKKGLFIGLGAPGCFLNGKESTPIS